MTTPVSEDFDAHSVAVQLATAHMQYTTTRNDADGLVLWDLQTDVVNGPLDNADFALELITELLGLFGAAFELWAQSTGGDPASLWREYARQRFSAED